MRYRLARVNGNSNVSLGRLWLLRCLIPLLDGLSLISLNDHVNFIFNVIHGELVPSVRRNLSFQTIHVVSPLASTGYSQTEVLSPLSKHRSTHRWREKCLLNVSNVYSRRWQLCLSHNSTITWMDWTKNTVQRRHVQLECQSNSFGIWSKIRAF